jgi:hypothetical protein
MAESTEHRPSFDTPLALNGPSIGRIVCTENLNPDILVMKPAKDGL